MSDSRAWRWISTNSRASWWLHGGNFTSLTLSPFCISPKSNPAQWYNQQNVRHCRDLAANYFSLCITTGVTDYTNITAKITTAFPVFVTFLLWQMCVMGEDTVKGNCTWCRQWHWRHDREVWQHNDSEDARDVDNDTDDMIVKCDNTTTVKMLVM